MISRLPTFMTSRPPEISCQTVLLRIEVVAALVDIGQLDRLAEADRARVRLLLAGDQLEQGRLAGAVGPDHADDAVGRQLERQVLEQDLVAVFLLQPLDLEHHIAQARAGRDLDGGEGLLLALLLGRPSRHRRPGGPWTWPGGPWRGAHPLQLAGHGALAGLALGLLLARRAFPSAPASRSSCPRRGCPCRDRAPASTWSPGRGSSGRG